ncbi:MAG TPA: cytochrome c-type biogenesis protein CcmH [Acidobacteriaceae bacterium]|nr:cytochrome c-type biogenesis protein CcmH [Acidobacteriaceae bacterium]
MREFRRRGRWIPRFTAMALAVGMVAALGLGVTDDSARFNDLGNKLMCTCGCGQVLLQCNHLGCPGLARESAELKADLAKGMSNNAILIAFQNEYGPTVLAAPMLTRFNMIAWIMPPLLLALGILGTVLLVRRWRQRAATMPAVKQTPEIRALREQVRRETEL